MLCTAYNGINPTVIENQIRRSKITKNKSFYDVELIKRGFQFLPRFVQSNSVVKSSEIIERVQFREF